MKHIISTEKPRHIIRESAIKKSNEYSYKAIIPKEVINIFPQLKEDAKLVFDIKQISIDKFECDITFQAKGMSITDDKEPAKTIDKPRQKSTEKKTTQKTANNEAGNKLNVKQFADIPIQDGKYTIKVTNPSRPKLRICGQTIKDEIDKNEIGLTVASKSKDEVQAIIDEIISKENADAKELNDLINGYRSEQYRT